MTSCSPATASTASPGAVGWRPPRCCGSGGAARTVAGIRGPRAWATTPSSSAPRRCTRSATRWASSATAPRPRRSPTSATAPPVRATSRRRSRSPPCYSAPVVFFCQNNQWAISEPLSRQTRVPLWQRSRGFGFPGVRVDGNDVLAVLAVTRAALARARAGGGPTLIEAFTYRMGAHTTSDDPSRYRDAAEVDEWRPRDPLLRVARYLRGAGVGEEFFVDLDREADEMAEQLRAETRALPDIDPLAVFDQVYAEPHPGDGRAAGRARRTPGLLRRHRRASVTAAGPVPGRIDDAAVDLALGAAINVGLRQAMEDDPKVLVLGEDVGRLGGVFRVTDGLQKDFGADRVDRHTAGRVRHRRHGHRTGRARLPAGVRDPVRRVRLSRLRPDREPAGEVPDALRRDAADARGDPDPLRGRHRRGRAPQRVQRDLLRAHGRPARGGVRDPRGGAPDDPAGGPQ